MLALHTSRKEIDCTYRGRKRFILFEMQFSAEVPVNVFPESRTMVQQILISVSKVGGVDRSPLMLDDKVGDGAGEEPEDVAEFENDDDYAPLYVSADESLESSSDEAIALPSQSIVPLAIRHSERERNIPGKYRDYDMPCVIPKRLSVSQEPPPDTAALVRALLSCSPYKMLWHPMRRSCGNALWRRSSNVPVMILAYTLWRMGSGSLSSH